MKILILCNDTRYLIDHRLNIVSALADQGHQVTVVAGGDPEWSAQLPARVEFHHLPLLRHRFSLAQDLSLIRSYMRFVRRLDPDVVHSFTIKPNLYGAIALKLLALSGRMAPRLVMTFPGLGKVFEPGQNAVAGLRRSMVGTGLKLATRGLDYHATFENHDDRDHLAGLGVFEADRCHTLLGAGVDLSRFVSRSALRTGPLTFLYASRLLKAKGVGAYMEAARLRRHQGSKADFLVAGPDDPGNPDNFGLENIRAAEAEGVIRYIGNFPAHEMILALEQADVVCLPTRLREGLPRILIEAAATGSAVIASDQPAIRSILPGAHCGWLVEDPSGAAIAQAMKHAEADPGRTREIGLSNASLIRAMPIDDSSITGGFITLYEGKTV
ncbi:glycosyltransferase [Hoeflea sp.]|uniref:glycosyltransferase n=1 Tax=Hoeflea sp. TaxID=1940281 RepID=UPI003BB213BC